MGSDVWCVDVDGQKISDLKNIVIPIYELGLSEMVIENQCLGVLEFTTEAAEALSVCEVCFIAVGTPMEENGSSDLRYVNAAAGEIGKHMCRHMYVVDKSTILEGTAGVCVV